MLRGSSEFADRPAYDAFLGEIFEGRNRRRVPKLADELSVMKALPPMRIEDLRRERVRVSSFSVVRAASNRFGQRANVRIICNLAAEPRDEPGDPPRATAASTRRRSSAV